MWLVLARFGCAFSALVWWLGASAHAAPQTELVSIPSRIEQTIRAIRLTPGRRDPVAEASIILLPGGAGRLDISKRGSIRAGKDDLLVRARKAFAEKGFDVLLPDIAPDFRRGKGVSSTYCWSARHAIDLGAMIAFMRDEAAPVYLVGNGSAALSAANAAARLRGDRRPDAIALTSGTLLKITRRRPSVVGMVPGLQRITQPVLLIGHEGDTCGLSPPGGIAKFRRSLSGARHVDIRILSGGKAGKGKPCMQGNHHGFLAQEAEIVDLISGWLKALPGT